MVKPRRDRDALRRGIQQQVRIMRDSADEMATMFDGCDDPLHPPMLTEDGQPFRDWVDFLDRVARPLVESEDDEAVEQAAMALYRKASPYFICTALVMAANRASVASA